MKFFLLGAFSSGLLLYGMSLLYGLSGSTRLADIQTALAARPRSDAMVWLARGEGMPHVIAEAGAASLPVIATPDNGTLEQIRPGQTGLFVPHEDPAAVADAMARLAADPTLRRALGGALRVDVERRFSADVIVPRWQALFDEVIAEGARDLVSA